MIEIQLTQEEFENVINGEDDNWIEEDSTVIYSNLTKGYSTTEIVFQRQSDKLYFKFTYDDSPYDWLGDLNEFPIIGKQVFPKQVTTIIYE